MGEPAFKLPEDETRPDIPGLRALEGGREGDGKPAGDLKAVADKEKGMPTEASDVLGKGFTGGIAAATGPAGSFLSKLFATRKRKAASGGIIGGIVGLLIFGATIGSGPLQLIHLSEVLAKNFNHSEEITKTRTKGLFRFARSGNVGETRVSYLGSRSYAKTINALREAGIEFSGTNKFSGALETTTIDPKKLSSKIPELKGMSSAQQQAHLSKFFGIDSSNFTYKDGKFTLNTNADIKLVRTLNSRSTTLLYSSKTVAAVKARPLSKYLNAPSLWHPLERLKASQNSKLGAKLTAREERDKARAEERERVRQQRIASGSKIASASDSIRNKGSGIKAAAGGALLITALACTARSAADDIVAYNNGIADAAEVSALDKIAVGAQLKYGGTDVEAARVGAIVDDMGNVWKGRALKETVAPGSSTNADPDIDVNVAQAFIPGDTAAGIKDSIGLGTTGAIVCSGPGQIVQLVGGLVLLAASVPTAGGSTAVFFGAKVAVGVVATAAAFHLINDLIVDVGKSDAIMPETLKDAQGGNILAYGARGAAAMSGRSSGEVLLSDKESEQIDQQEVAASRDTFMSKPLFARMFDANDYRSLVGRAADSMSPKMMQNFQTVATSLGSGHVFSSLFGGLLPQAHAADEPYKWASPRYGIPTSVLNNPEFSDPYENADTVASIINHDTGMIDRAKKCFGVGINKDSSGRWQVVPESAPNPNSSEYNDAHCNDMSDKNWQRMLLFVNDSRTMDALACLESDDTESCKLSGIGG